MADEGETESQMQDDVLIEILARLPVKSLVRFTCVCKYWLSIIKSPDFATKHYATSLNRLTHESHNFDCFFTTFSRECSIYICCAETMALKTAFEFRPAVAYQPGRFEISHRKVITEFFIYGPCNGLFLIRLIKRFKGLMLLLWNPATREVFKLPENNFNDGSYAVGLGFDHVTNDYKVINFLGVDCIRYPNSVSSLIPLYSLGANNWRQVDGGFNFSHLKRVYYHPSYTSSSLNGRKNHFISIDMSFGTDQIIFSLVTFDMVDEVFVQTAMPDEITARGLHFQGFLSQAGSSRVYPTIYSFGYNSSGHCMYDPIEMHVWALEGYGPTGVWNKQRSIIIPISQGCNEKVVLREITSCNFTVEQLKSLQILGDTDNIIGYTESLVSIASRLPSADHSAVETGSMQEDHLSVQIGSRDQNNSLVQIQENPKEDEDDDDEASSTVSYFHETDQEFSLAGKMNELKRMCNLPYCLREVNQPIISKPCTF